MRYATINDVPFRDLLAMQHGLLENTITDMDFLESLAAKRCFIVAPWVMQASPAGEMKKIATLTYSLDGQLDKPTILIAVCRKLKAIQRATLGRRFRI